MKAKRSDNNCNVANLEELFLRLAKSKFRSSFKLKPTEIAYLKNKGPQTIEKHAFDFVSKRLGPALPKNDGRQTPMKNHPVFIAQHATATCCRKCLEKWHKIPKGQHLTDRQVKYTVSVIMHWLSQFD